MTFLDRANLRPPTTMPMHAQIISPIHEGAF